MPEVTFRDAYGARFIIEGEEFEIRLPGDYQVQNAALSYAILAELRKSDPCLSPAGIREGFLQARWPARLTWIGNVLIDGAHNPQGATALTRYVQEFFPDAPRILVTAMMQDKAFAECAALYARAFDQVICTQIDYHRCATAQMMHDAFAAAGRDSDILPSIPEAIDEARARAGANGIVVVAGSLYLAGDAILHLQPELGRQI